MLSTLGRVGLTGRSIHRVHHSTSGMLLVYTRTALQKQKLEHYHVISI